MTVTAPAVAPATYRIDPARSTVRFSAGTWFGLSRVAGRFRVTGGTVRLAGNLTISRVAATVDAGSIATGDRRRDNALCSARFLDTARHPEIVFSSREVRDGTILGVLTVHGTGQWVTLDVTAIPTEEGCRFVATTRLDRRAFGITAGRGLVGSAVDVAVEVYASRS